MGLNRYSADLMQQCDIIIYHDGISNKNKELLNKIHNNIIFLEMVFPLGWESMLQDKRTFRWGNYVIAKLLGFELIKTYERVLFLDVDILIRGDISDLFEIEDEMAWRDVCSWSAKESFAHISNVLRNQNDIIGAPNGGLIYFTDKLLKYNIDATYIANAFSKIQSAKRGGTDEIVLAYIVYDKQIRLKELPHAQYNTSIYSMLTHQELQKTKIIHFLDYKSVPTKPWKSLAAYLFFDDWADNYQKWLELGGEGPIDFGLEDYCKLFSFDKVNKIEELNNKNKKLNAEIEENKKYIIELEKKYKDITNSNSWKLTEPLRRIKKKFKTFITT